MHYLTFLLGIVLLLNERWKGTKTLYEIKGPKNALGSFQGYSVQGCRLTIFCQRKDYFVKYDKWYMPNRSYFTYRVTSMVTGDAPEALKRACELDVDLPRFVSRFSFDKEVTRTAVHAYLDLLEARLDKSPSA